ncbi:MAG: hypothetical protein KC620_15060 [Myxococcales bacterium]|nr:hypothetical protein [Myxococcales bacterium]
MPYAAIDTYFAGERQLGLLLVPVGLLVIAAAFFAWRGQPGPFGVGLAIPLALLGLLGAGVGGGLALKTPGQVNTLKAALEEKPAEALAAERDRMAKVNANWIRLKLVWTAFALIGLGLILLGRKEWMPGVGVGLLIFAATLMATDVTAERRALVYTAALDAAP